MRAPQRRRPPAANAWPARGAALLLSGTLGLGLLSGCAPMDRVGSAAQEAASEVEHVQRPVESGSDARISATNPVPAGDDGSQEHTDAEPEAVRDANLEDRNLMPSRDAAAVPTQTPSEGMREKTVPVYWVGDTAEGLKLFREFRRSQDYGDPIATSVMAAFNGRPLDPDYAHHLPQIDRVGVSLALDNSITLDFPVQAFDKRYTPELASMLLQQIVYSATAAAAQASLGTPEEPYRVRILVEGQANQRVFSAIDLADEYVRDTSAIAAVWIVDPQQGQRLSPQIEVKGLSTSDTDMLTWTLYQSTQGSDTWTKIDFGSVSLESGESIFSQTYSLLLHVEPGTYRLQVQDPLSSSVDSKEFTVHED